MTEPMMRKRVQADLVSSCGGLEGVSGVRRTGVVGLSKGDTTPGIVSCSVYEATGGHAQVYGRDIEETSMRCRHGGTGLQDI